jgi:hypothetical protein
VFRRVVEEDVVICPGPIRHIQNRQLQYNEYVVYATNQIKIRYLVKVLFGPSHIPPTVNTANSSITTFFNYLNVQVVGTSNSRAFVDSILSLFFSSLLIVSISLLIRLLFTERSIVYFLFIPMGMYSVVVSGIICVFYGAVCIFSAISFVISNVISTGKFILDSLVSAGIKFVSSKMITMGGKIRSLLSNAVYALASRLHRQVRCISYFFN